jgi:hypothetical protein
MTERNDHNMTDPSPRANGEKAETGIESLAEATLRHGTPSRCPPHSYLESTLPAVVVPHLSLLVLSQEDVSTLFPWNAMVAVSPRDSSLCQWLTTGIPGMPAGPFLSSMVFYRHQTSRGSNGRCVYKPIFATIVTSAGVPPYIMTIHHDWFAVVLTCLDITADGRSVHHLRAPWIQEVLNSGGHDPPSQDTHTEWQFEVMTKQLILPGRRTPEYSHPYLDRELIANQRPLYTRKTTFLTMFRNLSSGLEHDGTELTPGSKLNALMACRRHC